MLERSYGCIRMWSVWMALCILFSHSVLAESRTPHRAPVTINGLSEQLSQNNSPDFTVLTRVSAEQEVIRPVTIKTFVYGEGHIDISITTKRNFSTERFFTEKGRQIPDSTRPTFLQGKIALGGGLRRSPSARVSQTALSLINNKLRVTFLGRKKGTRGRQRLYTIHTTLTDAPTTTVRVSSIPSHATRNGACSTPVEDIGGHRHANKDFKSDSQPKLSAQTLVTTRVATLSTDADPEWYAKFGSESNAEILRVINTAEALFFRNFGITFRIVKQHTYTDSSPYTSTRADYLLSQFVRNPANPVTMGISSETFDADVDLKHLFTGKSLDSNILGIAYIGSLCATPNLAYGVTQLHIFDTTYGIFAHEISHSMGAFHDANAPGTVMYPSISIPPTDTYSAKSVTEIREFLLRSNACLSTETTDRPGGDVPGSIEGPAVAPRALTLKQQSTKGNNTIRLRGALTEGSGISVGGTTINLIIKNSVVATTTTNTKGTYTFTVSSRRFAKRGTSVYVATEDWGTISKPLSVSVARSKR